MSHETPRISSPVPTVARGAASEIADHKADIFFAAIELTRMPMLVTDPRQDDNPIVFANRAFVSMSGYPLEKLLGRNCRFLQGPDTDPGTIDVVRDAIAMRQEVSVELLNYRADGSSFWNALFVSPVFNDAGELVYFFASQLDVSRRRDMEEVLAHSQKMEALGQLTGGISHDFNNLLQVMSGHLDVLVALQANGTLSPAQLDACLASIRSAVTKASTLTQQLLAFSRKQKLQGRVISLNHTARSMESLIARTLGETIGVEYELDESTPTCELDSTQLEVALLNLLVNARDALPAGGRIRLRTKRVEVASGDEAAFGGLPAGVYGAIAISDNGLGIPASIIDRVMDPFFTTKEEGRGTGLGLASVYGFAKQSGGLARIYSEEGVGTTVRLYFPAADGPVATSPPPRATHLRGGTEAILVVDDREEVANIATSMLQGVGYDVRVAYSGADALALLGTDDGAWVPDLLFTDVVMPGGLNGYVLAQQVRQKCPGVHVLLTTGFDRELATGARGATPEFDVLEKPYRLNDLLRRVRGILDGATAAA